MKGNADQLREWDRMYCWHPFTQHAEWGRSGEELVLVGGEGDHRRRRGRSGRAHAADGAGAGRLVIGILLDPLEHVLRLAWCRLRHLMNRALL